MPWRLLANAALPAHRPATTATTATIAIGKGVVIALALRRLLVAAPSRERPFDALLSLGEALTRVGADQAKFIESRAFGPANARCPSRHAH